MKRRCHIDALIDYTEEKDISLQKEIEIKEHIKMCPECGEKYSRLKLIENYCFSTVEAPAEIYGNIMNGIDIERYSDKNFDAKMRLMKVRRLAKPIIAVAAIFILVFSIYTNKDYISNMGKEVLAALNTKHAESSEEKVNAAAEYNSKDTISTRDLDKVPDKSILYLKGRNGIKYFSTEYSESDTIQHPLTEMQVRLLEQELSVNFDDYVHFKYFTYIIYYFNEIRYEAQLYSNAEATIRCSAVTTSSNDKFIDKPSYPLGVHLYSGDLYSDNISRNGSYSYAFFHFSFTDKEIFEKADKITMLCKGEEFTKTIRGKRTFIIPIPTEFIVKNWEDPLYNHISEWDVILYDKYGNTIYERNYFDLAMGIPIP